MEKWFSIFCETGPIQQVGLSNYQTIWFRFDKFHNVHLSHASKSIYLFSSCLKKMLVEILDSDNRTGVCKCGMCAYLCWCLCNIQTRVPVLYVWMAFVVATKLHVQINPFAYEHALLANNELAISNSFVDGVSHFCHTIYMHKSVQLACILDVCVPYKLRKFE